MDWKEFLKKYGLYIALGLIAVYLLLRNRGGATNKQQVAGRPAATGSTASPRSIPGTIQARPAQAPMQGAQPQLRRGGTTTSQGAVLPYLSLIIGVLREFGNLLDRMTKISSTQSRTPKTFPGSPRVPTGRRDTSLIRIIDASGVETVIASGYYDVAPDFGSEPPAPDSGAGYWGNNDSGQTFGSLMGGSGGGGFVSGIPDLLGTIGNLGAFDWVGTNTESELPEISFPEYGAS